MALRRERTSHGSRRTNRREFMTEILSDLGETSPQRPMTMPDPYDEGIMLERNVADLFYQLRWSIRIDKRIEGLVMAFYLGQFLERRPLTPQQRMRCRRLLTTHYITCCVRIYDLFSIQGIEQIYRTKKTCFWMFRSIKKHEFTRLITEAEDTFYETLYDVGTS